MAGIVSSERAARLAEHLRNPKELATAAPVPTVSIDAPGYDPRTWGWNGPSWIPSNWLVMESFARTGMTDDSNRIMQAMESMMSNPDGWPGAYEQYDSQTGMPFGVVDYSWSGAVNDYLTRWVAGVQPNAARHTLVIAPHLFPGWTSFEVERLHIGNDVIGYEYESSGGQTRILLNDDGPDAFQTEVVLPANQTPHQLSLDGAAMAPAAYHLENGLLHIAVPGHGTRTLEVLQ
jgi:hypothetical protein